MTLRNGNVLRLLHVLLLFSQASGGLGSARLLHSPPLLREVLLVALVVLGGGPSEPDLSAESTQTGGWCQMKLASIFFFARRFERETPKRPSIVKCLAVQRQPKMPQHTTWTDVGQI